MEMPGMTLSDTSNARHWSAEPGECLHHKDSSIIRSHARQVARRSTVEILMLVDQLNNRKKRRPRLKTLNYYGTLEYYQKYYDIKVRLIILCKMSFAKFRRVATLYKRRPTLKWLRYAILIRIDMSVGGYKYSNGQQSCRLRKLLRHVHSFCWSWQSQRPATSASTTHVELRLEVLSVVIAIVSSPAEWFST